MELQIKAKLVQKFTATTHGETFKKMEFIIEIDSKYPQLVKMEVHNDNILKVEDLPTGTIADWHFNLRGKKWINPETKKVLYFNSLVAWRAEVLDTDLAELNANNVTNATEPLPLKTSELTDDLPF
tara:strand:- start:2383 stop:2760 length:378 start_codon:yes stop_codon:yes gene_type:complete